MKRHLNFFKVSFFNQRIMKSPIMVIFLFMSYSTYSEVDITTLDNFGIFSTSEHNLIISKQGDKDRNSFLAYRMERPLPR